MSSEGHGGSTFNIGSQQAGAIYQSAGDQAIYRGGGQLATNVLDALSDIRIALESATPALSADQRHEADHLMSSVEAEARRPEPDKHRIADALSRIAALLKGAGALAGSAEAFHQVAAWLGPVAAGLL